MSLLIYCYSGTGGKCKHWKITMISPDPHKNDNLLGIFGLLLVQIAKKVPLCSRIGPLKVQILPESPFYPFYNIFQHKVPGAKLCSASTELLTFECPLKTSWMLDMSKNNLLSTAPLVNLCFKGSTWSTWLSRERSKQSLLAFLHPYVPKST